MNIIAAILLGSAILLAHVLRLRRRAIVVGVVANVLGLVLLVAVSGQKTQAARHIESPAQLMEMAQKIASKHYGL